MTDPIWTPSKDQVEGSNLYAFMQGLKGRRGFSGGDWPALHRWSVEHMEAFWEEAWLDAQVKTSAPHSAVLTGHAMPVDRMPPREVWFPGLRFNFAEHLLRFRDGRVALIAASEETPLRRVTYRELYGLVARCQAGLKTLGLKAGDRVAGFMPNTVETVVAMLASTALGAIWSSTSPDFGFEGVMDRFGQITPKVLFCANGYRYNGKSYHSLEQVRRIAKEIPSIEQVVVLPFLEGTEGSLPGAMSWDDLLGAGGAAQAEQVEFQQFPFDQPLYILYSSGTTGVPKCIVHGAGGTLLKHHVEQKFHTDLRREDILFFFTTCGWMMWNWLVSGLAQGATLLLYDGSPVHPDGAHLFKLAEETGVTVFGTSPKFLASCQKAGLTPGSDFDLSRLRCMLSTGAPLEAEQFRYVYDAIKADLQLASISGGTDIVGCFMAGNPLLPVYAGEIQSAGLGVDLAAYGEDGVALTEEKGELVCRNPLPSMPIGFWEDPRMEKYRAAYFSTYPGVWHHGDYITITGRGGIIVFGRSDATLNPGGVRIGTAEIYRIVEDLPYVLDSLVVGQRAEGDVRVVLFVVLSEGQILDAALEREIRAVIRAQATPRHVPAVIRQIAEVPVTINGKKVELAVGRMLHGEPVKNRDAMANPGALDQFKNLSL
ncbi:MAG: acetoacetate--CoA ligase [SAR324 cluster bacterium]|nr:acetoacetate--CoA ligase [SAR324 cluster bacterium]